MEPASDAQVTQTPSSTYWFDGDGVLCAVVKKDAPDLKLEDRSKNFENFKSRLGDKKICMIVDITNAAPLSREAQHFNLSQYPKVFKAIAFVSRSAYGRMLGHLYLGMHANPFPLKIFSDDKEARKWIAQFF